MPGELREGVARQPGGNIQYPIIRPRAVDSV